ncbi:Nif3-like dinuclear metal center hexameric protein [Bifidobacterium amazonense]|uniref:GTP cyclohydrolase 1 type 2 homolog n=1 Tax=Bifidobacterium amazonense TaxID=2809027 RepID=A0ABS9VU68_9BIFI|nr:Nif3-like dinuclear metal center hexameric protein [Bifidobacterium amazonense]MCH9275643.1 Nif3-like dinuclear metal center hexameric protein [Bifidobacterium amazonense]
MPTLRQVVDVLETLYPLRYAEHWDAPGLIVGDPARPVRRIAFAADPTAAVIDAALANGTDLLVTHHPLLFRAVHEVSAMGAHGDVVRRLYESGCALWVGHTNADAAFRGVGQAAADAFGLVDQHPLVPIRDDGSATAGHEAGLGRVGRLETPMTFEAFARRVADALPHTELGVTACGPLDQTVETVAVLPGSGDSLFDEVRASGADVYVTSDLRHHPATDAIEQARHEAGLRAKGIRAGLGDARIRPLLINTPHSAIESLWFRYALEDVPAAVERATGERPEAEWLRINTDPWTLRL